jgi:hypothetical protein
MCFHKKQSAGAIGPGAQLGQSNASQAGMMLGREQGSPIADTAIASDPAVSAEGGDAPSLAKTLQKAGGLIKAPRGYGGSAPPTRGGGSGKVVY